MNTATANSRSLISHTMLLLFKEHLHSLATQTLVLTIGWFGMGDKLQTACRVLKPETNQKVNEEKNYSFFFSPVLLNYLHARAERWVEGGGEREEWHGDELYIVSYELRRSGKQQD